MPFWLQGVTALVESILFHTMNDHDYPSVTWIQEVLDSEEEKQEKELMKRREAETRRRRSMRRRREKAKKDKKAEKKIITLKDKALAEEALKALGGRGCGTWDFHTSAKEAREGQEGQEGRVENHNFGGQGARRCERPHGRRRAMERRSHMRATTRKGLRARK